MLEEYIQKMWFRQPDAADTEDGRKIAAAQADAVENMDDFRFSVNIALIRDNVERNPVNAENIFHYFDKEITPSFQKLDERLSCACRLDWYACLFRMLADIAEIPRALKDKKSASFAKALDMSAKWTAQRNRYLALEQALPEGERCASFDAWLEKTDRELVQPVTQEWKRAEAITGFHATVRRIVTAGVVAVIAWGIWQIRTGTGPLASALGIHRPRLVSEETITKEFGELYTEQVPVADFNASTILETDDGSFSDRLLMDGDVRTAWAEGEPNDGTGRRLYFNIEKTMYVHYIVVYNGNEESDETFRQYNRLRNVTLRIRNDGTNHNYTFSLKDEEGPQYILVNGDVDRFWIIMNSVYRGTDSDNITCVSEVEIY